MLSMLAEIFKEVQAYGRHKVTRKHFYFFWFFWNKTVCMLSIYKQRLAGGLPDADISGTWPHARVSFEILKVNSSLGKMNKFGDKLGSESVKTKIIAKKKIMTYQKGGDTC